MKQWMSKKSNIFFVLIMMAVVIKQYPLLLNNLDQEDKIIPVRNTLSYTTNKLEAFPGKNRKVMAIFWATWCGPCKVEMERLKSSVESGAIPRDAIFAINPFESEKEIRKFMDSHSFPFNFIDSSLGKELGVAVTPTTLFIDNGKIESMSSGMSLWGIWKAELFL